MTDDEGLRFRRPGLLAPPWFSSPSDPEWKPNLPITLVRKRVKMASFWWESRGSHDVRTGSMQLIHPSQNVRRSRPSKHHTVAQHSVCFLLVFCFSSVEAYKPKRLIGFLQFAIIINVLVSSFRFIWIRMLRIYGHYKYFTLSVRASISAGLYQCGPLSVRASISAGLYQCGPLSVRVVKLEARKDTLC